MSGFLYVVADSIFLYGCLLDDSISFPDVGLLSEEGFALRDSLRGLMAGRP